MQPVDRPLAGIRIIDAVTGPLAPITRYLADLGADVVRVVAMTSPAAIDDLAANAGKRCLSAGEGDAVAELGRAHAVVASPDAAIDLAALRASRPALVTMLASDFGSNGPLTQWQATGPVLHALTGELARSGIRGRPPLLPPGNLAYECAAVQAAFALTAALYNALRTGRGDHIDFAALDGAMQALDPGYGIGGSATMGKPAHLLSRERPPLGFQYPILPCADGHVRVCLLARRQWRGMFTWMGEPAAFADPAFDAISTRYKSPDLLPAIAAVFASRTRAELEREGQHHGVPISGVFDLAECLASDHMRARHAVTNWTAPDGRSVTLPNGVMTIDGERMGPQSAPASGAIEWPAPSPAVLRPFDGLKVLDLGVIVVGAEQGRLLADLGADVIKVESRAYPDGNRQSHLSYGLSAGFAAGHRNKRSLGINLRDPEGRALFLALVGKADVILSNFKPGTLEALGLGPAQIAAHNPRAVRVDSSAFGASGPWSGRMGYGPLVRAATGLTMAWRYPDDPQSFSDAVTVYPDHVAGRVGALAAVALLIRRLRTGEGGMASIAQSEVMLAHFAVDIARVADGQPGAGPPDWPWAAYPTAGDDEWCVVTVRNDRDWEALCRVSGIGSAGQYETAAARLADRDTIDAGLEAWLAGQDADVAAQTLQAAGVPAARMLRVSDLPHTPHASVRLVFRDEHHPFLPEPMIAERWHAPGLRGIEPEARPAPLAGQHSAEVVREWLGLGDSHIARLEASGSLEPVDDRVLADAMAAGSARQ